MSGSCISRNRSWREAQRFAITNPRVTSEVVGFLEVDESEQVSDLPRAPFDRDSKRRNDLVKSPLRRGLVPPRESRHKERISARVAFVAVRVVANTAVHAEAHKHAEKAGLGKHGDAVGATSIETAHRSQG